MDDTAMKEAKWIWTEGDGHARNAWALFRRNFVIEDRGSLESALLRVCADTRYEAVLNGKRLGGGPVRSWPDELYYDSYPLSGAGKIGNNRLEILVNHFGLGTCVSIEGAAGLIAEILLDGADGGEPKRIVTDDSWLVAEHPGYVRTVPKMSNGLSWSEVFRADIASDEASWNWRPATVRGGEAHSSRRLLPRDIDYLTDEAVFPADVLSLREVRRRGFVRSVNLRALAFPGELDLNKHKLFRGFIGFSLVASRAMSAHVAIANDPHDSKPLSLKLNGKTLRVENGKFLELALDAGDNWILVNVSGMFHDPEFHFVFDLHAGCSLEPLFPPDLKAPSRASQALTGQDCDELCFVGPFGSISRIQAGEPLDLELPPSPEFDRLLALTERGELAKFSRFAVALGTDTVSPHHVALDSFYQTTLRDIPVTFAIRQICRPSVDDQASAGAEILSRSGDSELTLDFGKELSGYLEWDVDAPSGTELDFFCYESQHDGIVEHTFSLNNTVRYVCREGRQRYRSPVRRGFRFCRLTIRSPGGPVRIRQVRLNFATYPVPVTGRFRSSDYQLTRIWELCRHTVRVCMEDTFVDCPAYEQTLWTGDSFTSSLFSHYLFGRYEFPAHGNRLAAKSLERSPLIESTIPSAWQNVIPNWSFLWVQSCVDHFLYSGDRATFEDLFPALMLTVRNAEKFIPEDGPLRGLFSIDAWEFHRLGSARFSRLRGSRAPERDSRLDHETSRFGRGDDGTCIRGCRACHACISARQRDRRCILVGGAACLYRQHSCGRNEVGDIQSSFPAFHAARRLRSACAAKSDTPVSRESSRRIRRYRESVRQAVPLHGAVVHIRRIERGLDFFGDSQDLGLDAALRRDDLLGGLVLYSGALHAQPLPRMVVRARVFHRRPSPRHTPAGTGIPDRISPSLARRPDLD